LTHYAKGTSFSSDCFFHIISSSFHSIFMVLFIIPSRYFYTINHWFIFLVCGWFHIIFTFLLYFFFFFFFFFGFLPFFFFFFFFFTLFFFFIFIRDFTLYFLFISNLINYSLLLISFATTFNISVDFFSSHYLRSFSLWGFSFFGFPFGFSFIADYLQKNFVIKRPY